jgi:hypothetical protein
MLMKRRAFFAMFIGLAMVGCGGPQPVSVTPAPPPPARPLLESIAASGEMGSEIELIQDSLEKMKATDQQKAEELLSDLETLKGMKDAGQIKAQAQKMANKL